MALPSPPPPHRSPRRWRFTWEALAHMPTLRLFLFNTEVDPSLRCGGLKASLCLEERRLHVSWTEEGAGDLALMVPVPRVLIDPVSPVQMVAREDHIEVKLALVLPLDHPMSVSFRAALGAGGAAAGQEQVFSDCSLPLSLDSDIKSLSGGDIHFYCKACCTRLTRRPLRNFVEMPSANWREVADNWFGACCCSFGGASERLVEEYIKSYSCSEATCLLDGPSVTICKDDLDGYAFQNCPEKPVDKSNMLNHVVKTEDICSETVCEGSPNGCQSLGCMLQKNWGPIDDPTEHSLNERKVTTSAEKMNCNNDSDALLVSSVNQVFSEESAHCCLGKTNNLLTNVHGRPQNVSVLSTRVQSSMGKLSSHTSQNWSSNGPLGNGFLIKTSNLSSDVEWVEFLCWRCSSFLGSYPIHQGVNDPVDGGIRLFKCFVSTSMNVSGLHNIFRKHTLQRIFVTLLLESATDELSFRTILRDLCSKLPMLQIILLNSKAWCSSGDCFENETFGCLSLSEVKLQPVVKVLFSDCSTGANPRAIEQWVTTNRADEVYMMARQVKELGGFLKLAHDSLPTSYSLFQGMSLSYMEM